MQQEIYESYNKPPLSPPPYIFGLVWSFLYLLIFISFGFVFWKALKRKIPWKVTIPFVLNLLANFTYTYLQFHVQNFTLASIDVVIILLTLLWAMISIWKYYRWVTYIQIPYLIWTLFATYLQIGITVLNR